MSLTSYRAAPPRANCGKSGRQRLFLLCNKAPAPWEGQRRRFRKKAQGMSGRVVLLTGAAGGIGRVMTTALLADGHSVAAVDRDRASLDRLTELAGRQGAERLCSIRADLQDLAAAQEAVAAAKRRFGGVDAVVNNAGIG